MKKTYTLLVLALLAVGISGCKKEKDPYDSGSLVGKWTLNKRIFTQTRDGVEYNKTTNTDFNGYNLQFNADSSGMAADNNGRGTFKWNILRDQLTLTQRVGEQYNVLYSSYRISTLNAKELHMISEYHYTKEDNAKWVDISDEYYTR